MQLNYIIRCIATVVGEVRIGLKKNTLFYELL